MKHLIYSSIAILLLASTSYAESGAAFLKISPSARSYALGQSNTVSALGAQAITANPANMHRMNSRMEVFSSFLSLIGDAKYAHAAFAINRSPSGKRMVDALGFSVTHLKIAGLEGRDSLGNATGNTFGSGDTALAISMATRHSSGMRIGLTAKVIQSEIAGYKSDISPAADLGLNYDMHFMATPLSLGLSYNNFGQGIKFIEQRDPLPTSVNAGAAIELGPVTSVFQVSRLMNDQLTNMSLGFEYGLGVVALRAGYRTASGGASNLALQSQEGMVKLFQNLTTGLGIKIGSASMDYALSQEVPEFGLSHRISVTVKWGENNNMSETRLNTMKKRLQARKRAKTRKHREGSFARSQSVK